MEAFLVECMKKDKELFKSKMKKKKYKEQSSLNKDCSICMDKFQDKQLIKTLNCNHQFHNKCINLWLKKEHHNCPLCRKDQNEY